MQAPFIDERCLAGETKRFHDETFPNEYFHSSHPFGSGETGYGRRSTPPQMQYATTRCGVASEFTSLGYMSTASCTKAARTLIAPQLHPQLAPTALLLWIGNRGEERSRAGSCCCCLCRLPPLSSFFTPNKRNWHRDPTDPPFRAGIGTPRMR